MGAEIRQKRSSSCRPAIGATSPARRVGSTGRRASCFEVQVRLATVASPLTRPRIGAGPGQFSSSASGPLLCTMEKAQDLDALRSRPHAIDKNEGRSTYDQFASSASASDPPDLRMVRQHVALPLNFPELIERSARIFLRDVVYGVGETCLRRRQPDDVHALSPLMRASSLARWRAMSCLTTSWDTHSILGSSASFMASSTCARNHLS